MSALPFTKMQAVGNDFVVVHEPDWPADTDWPAAAIRLCDRHFGAGSDGLVIVGPSEISDIRMRFFNPDGTPDMCGNGLRCAAEFAYRNDLLTPDDLGNVSLESPAGEHTARRTGDSENNGGRWMIAMGAPRFEPWQVPVIVDGDDALNYDLDVEGHILTVSSVWTGTPHTVIFMDKIVDEATFALSPKIETHPLFPERTSVLWATPDPNASNGDAFFIRIWERGAGETLGCGTGACAVAVIARKTGWTEADLVITASKGGALAVRWNPGEGGGTMLLAGSAEIVYSGKAPQPHA